jgi:hypothetical protein
MEVHLEPGGVEARDVRAQALRVDEAEAGVGGGVAARVEVRLGQPGREVLHHTRPA